MTEEAHRLIKTIKDMEASLEDNKHSPSYGSDDGRTTVTYPLMRCIQGLKDKYNMVSKIHRERFEQVRSMPPVSRLTVDLLTNRRTRRSPRIIRVASRVFLRSDQAPSYFPQRHHLPLV